MGLSPLISLTFSTYRQLTYLHLGGCRVDGPAPPLITQWKASSECLRGETSPPPATSSAHCRTRAGLLGTLAPGSMVLTCVMRRPSGLRLSSTSSWSTVEPAEERSIDSSSPSKNWLPLSNLLSLGGTIGPSSRAGSAPGPERDGEVEEEGGTPAAPGCSTSFRRRRRRIWKKMKPHASSDRITRSRTTTSTTVRPEWASPEELNGSCWVAVVLADGWLCVVTEWWLSMAVEGCCSTVVCVSIVVCLSVVAAG
ncbi:hypothetical protein GGR56DRAFT_169240 [Xylariaceae sp. FL0804]|nr:hypothetical protein GGR56DRAFT_169240 [Xylariaceae sp. FL0804]